MSIKLHVWGDFACFTRPEMKVERVSYDVISPSAARSLVEAVYWKPQIRWQVTSLHVIKPIRFTSLRRNEVASKAPSGSIAKAMKNGRGSLGLYIEDDRQQRAATILRDVSYVIEARFDILSGEENVAKHLDQFNRRARDGRCFQRPYLGCREFAADFALVEDDHAMPSVDPELMGERDLGYMLHDIDFAHDMTPHFFRAVMRDGVIEVPPLTGKGVKS
ncbi:MAG: type I-C CRISPR-associated protein Cas5c [Paludisphaera borealis]|uniref:type I-C CRISPR-associated protein Cas5c n=1 Tax=Paludisphaera borealis TaxID=1387353 RepID=UPI00284DAEFD|nr:type I-C CRISPR-associated protein Cas5c [Paludisphaera borealis]MDR3619244.1 type I-C CRISPR-associated protein Cas5c [Paludisphaera borealis]